ncbi:MAG TPA: type IV secretion system protein TraC [Burkholderiaceae bacterium]|nr:type IV secretion system protein TraC [Burkholderiaceae bacterium]
MLTATGSAAARFSGFLGSLFGLRDDESPASRFASWLPYVAQLEVERIFVNTHGLGFVLDVYPQTGADQEMEQVLQALFVNCPAGTGVQMHMYGSPQVRDILLRYANQRAEDDDQLRKAAQYGRPARNDNFFRKVARRRFAYLQSATRNSLSSGFHFTLRDYRLLVSVTVPGDANNLSSVEAVMALRARMQATLSSANLPSRACDADFLVNWCAGFLNPGRMLAQHPPQYQYDAGRELRDQMVDHDTIQDDASNYLRLWKEDDDAETEVRFLSVRSYPKEFRLAQMGALTGDLMQPALQYSTPFLLTLGVKVQDPADIAALVTANNARAQQNAESKLARIMPDVQAKQRDWDLAAKALDRGGGIVYLYHQLALFCPPHTGVAAQEAAQALWRARGFELNADVYMAKQGLLASMPMTLSDPFFADMRKMRRVTRKTTANAVNMSPLLAEWKGSRTPTLLFAGRRGQLVGLDLFDSPENYTAAVVGVPGSGKSVLLNEIAWSYLSVGAKVFLIDLGRSFQRLCKMARGQYIEFRPDSRIGVNPFSMVTEPREGNDGEMEGGINEDIGMIKPILMKMCSMNEPLEPVQEKALVAVVLEKFAEYGRDLNVTGVRDALRGGTVRSLELVNDQRIKDLAVMLTPYTRDGEYARFFEGKANIDFSNDLLVVENEELLRKPELHTIITMLLTFQITGQMYLTRDRKKILGIDEIKQQIRAATSADDAVIAGLIEGASRRARKYGGSLITATQNGADYFESTQMQAAIDNADFLFMLRQKPESLQMLQDKKRISVGDHEMRLLQSIRAEESFRECYIKSSLGDGLVRIVLDPYSRLLFSNRIEDNKPLDDLMARGLSVDQAVTQLLNLRGIVA